MIAEEDRVRRLATWYSTEQLGFDRTLVGLRYRTLKPHFRGSTALELGPADGEMTRLLVSDFERVTVVDAAAELLEKIPALPSVHQICSLFEDLRLSETFDTIMMEHVLEHVEDPVGLLQRSQAWLSRGGRILAGVPNGQSIHRLVAVKMGLLGHPCELNERDLSIGHRRVYIPETFRRDLEAAGLRVLEVGGVFFKPVSNAQIEAQWTAEMIEGFYQIGKEFPDYAAELFAVCDVG